MSGAFLATMPDEEFAALVAIYEAKGLSGGTAQQVAAELTANGPLAAHLDAELHLDADDMANPLQAAAASAISFTIGAVLPLVAILVSPQAWRVLVTIAVVLIALAITGGVSARLGDADPRRAVLRVVIGGAIGLVVTYLIGSAFGSAIS